MHRAILVAWIPCLLWMLGAVLVLLLVMRMSGAQLQLVKLRRLHRCQDGSVQTLSFVLTLPLFILLVMFIVQVAELMIGIAGVHYAAFATARAACVWIPADVPGSSEPANAFQFPSLKTVDGAKDRWVTNEIDNSTHQFDYLWKLRKIGGAAALACVPISPSRDYGVNVQMVDNEENVVNEMVSIARALSPTVQRYPRSDRVIRRKLHYALANTRIRIRGRNTNLSLPPDRIRTYFLPDPQQTSPLQEVGWEDAMEVTVFHYFALLPGPGRILATRLGNSGGVTDRVSDLIVKPGAHKGGGFGFINANKYRDKLRAVALQATVTISNEGLKSVMPYAHPND